MPLIYMWADVIKQNNLLCLNSCIPFLQDKEALQQQQYNNLIQISTLQSKLDEIRHRVLPEEDMDHMLQGELKAQEELLTKKREVS